MKSYLLNLVRVLAVMIVVSLSLSALPMLAGVHVTKDAAAAPVTEVKVGWMSGIQFWNPMNPKMVEDYVVMYHMYSCLFMYGQDWEGPVNDLATGWYQHVNPNGTMTTTVNITSHAYFRNKAAPNDISHPLTAYDAKYTFDRIMASGNTGGTWETYLYNVTNIKVNSNTQLEFLTSYPKATLIDDIAEIPIIPQYIWSSIPDGDHNGQFLGPMSPGTLVGSGPFYYDGSAATWYRFVAAPNYHGAADYGAARTVKIGSILYTVYGDPQSLALAMNSGQEDTIDLSGQPNLFQNTLGVGASVNVVKQAVQEQGICDIAVNAIPLATMQGNKVVNSQWRTNTYGTGNPILQDPIVRKALAMTLDKNTIKTSIMKDLVTIADSVVQPNYWHDTSITNLAFDPAAAKTMLNAAGYVDTDSDGVLEVTSSAYVYGNNSGLNINVPAGTELSFRLHAPTNEPSYMQVAQNWVAWAALGGIKFTYKALSESVMTNADWFKSDYDVWVWHWGWSPEPLGAILSVWITQEIRVGGYNCQGPMGPWWYGPDNATQSPTGKVYSAFDQNWSTALTVLDKAQRKVYVDRLQQMIFNSYTEIPPFYDVGLYGYTDERFVGWGDWEAHPGLSHKSDLPWLWFNLDLKGNTRPEFDTPLNPTYTAIVNQPITFQVIVHDADATDSLWVNWSFGDGSPIIRNTTGPGVTTPTMFSQTHTYTVLNPLPGDMLNVTLWDGQPNHEKSDTTTVYVVSLPDNGPSLGAVSASPPVRQYNSTPVTWSASASDHESGGASGYGLLFTWDWGDGTYTVTHYQPTANDIPVVDTKPHSWQFVGIYNVQVHVWDGFGLQTDPSHNISSGQIPYEIIEDSPPDIPTISAITGTEGTWVTCVASSIDNDPFSLRFTWQWDDGTFNVTNHDNSATYGTSVNSIVMHVWAAAGIYPVTVWVDDLTGIAGHNSSWSDNADITPVGVNVPPSALLLSATPTTAYNDTPVVFNASAIDTDGDPLTFTIDYGDGNASVATTAGGVTTRQYVVPDFTHGYAVAGSYSPTLYADDGQGHNVSKITSVEVVENERPWLLIQSSLSATYNKTFTIEPTQVTDNDSADVISVWYNWSDGTPMTRGNPASSYSASHVYHVVNVTEVTVWIDDGTGLVGHNVSKVVKLTINQNLPPQFKAAITKMPSKTAYNQSESITFNFKVWDYEGDNLTLIVQWGDGQVTTETLDPAANATSQWNLTHSYAASRIDPYKVNATIKDDADHYSPQWSTATVNVQVNKPTGPTAEPKSTPWMLYGGIAAAVAALLIITLLLMRRKKGEKPAEGKGGMEGMAPPEPPPPAQ